METQENVTFIVDSKKISYFVKSKENYKFKTRNLGPQGKLYEVMSYIFSMMIISAACYLWWLHGKYMDHKIKLEQKAEDE